MPEDIFVTSKFDEQSGIVKVLITGICGFVGHALAGQLMRLASVSELIGMDNLSRPGSELHRASLRALGVPCIHGDLRLASDLESWPAVDWVIDAAANPSVLGGISGIASSRQILEHNLVGTLNLAEYCKRHKTGLVLISTSRVYSCSRLSSLPMQTQGEAFAPRFNESREAGLSPAGISEMFSDEPPLSLYGAAKRASEIICLEYGRAFGLPVFVNRCGVMAGAGQFGKADQGIFSYWIHSYRSGQPLRYIGFGGTGYQVRDCLHPSDLAALVSEQMRHPEKAGRILNVAGGVNNSISLAQLSSWCARRFGPREVQRDGTERPYDVPWLVLDSTTAAEEWNWRPSIGLESILDEIAVHAEANPGWLEISRDR